MKKKILVILLILVVFLILVFRLTFSIYKLEQGGMEPEIPNGSTIVIQKNLGFQTNDIVIFTADEGPVIYRIMASPSEEIKFFSALDVKGYSVSLSGDDKALDRLDIIDKIIEGIVPDDIYILKGDSSDLSYIVSKEDILGKYVFIF